ncbi:urease accessory protein UreD [Roseibium sp.]|uniref:urease accessory protein UreD n=1 Tax=Roseibium sp. TaxID=1936156 RepID=UPI003A9746D1
MYDAAIVNPINDNAPRMQRVSGRGHVAFKHASGRTRLSDLHQSGSAKIRLPKVYDGVPVAVLINTSGGLTGGDRLTYEAGVDAGGHAIVTSQAAERAYRSSGGVAEIENRLTAGNGATLEWLPQETILFNASGLHRTMTVNLSGDARLLAIESVVLGRTAMGETVDRISFRDRWRIQREGRLVFADDVRLEGDASDILKGPATAGGGLAFATLVDCAVDADTRLGLARDALGQLKIRAAASAWNGVLVVRFVGADGRSLRDGLMTFLETYRSAGLPRVWHC